MKSLVEQLKEYLSHATKEQLDKDWMELEEWSNVGPELSDWIKSLNKKY